MLKWVFALGLTVFAGYQSVAAEVPAEPPTGNRIINLYDAFGPDPTNGAQKDWGYSALIEYNGKRILFDAGNNADVFQKNVEALKIDLTKVDFAVLSHAHADHLSGFDYAFSVNPNLKLYVPYDRHVLGGNTSLPSAGPEKEAVDEVSPEERYYSGNESVAINPTPRWWKKDIVYVKEDVDLGDGIRLIFTKSPYLGESNSYPPNESSPKILPLNELSLSLATPKGQVLIVGCSHSGVENIVKETKSRLSTNVYAVVGGFHLFPYPRVYVNNLAKVLKDELNVQQVSPAHCTGHLGLVAFKKVYGDQYIRAGLGTVVEVPQ